MRVIKRVARPFGRATGRIAQSARIRDFPDPYYTLVCNHVTDRDTQIVYACWKPKGNKHYCEPCGRWVARKPNPPRTSIPESPMF